MTHVLHDCPNMDGREWGKLIAWPKKEIPLNIDAGHENCPYCGTPTAHMAPASAAEVALLNAGPLGRRNLSGGGRAPAGGPTMQQLLDEVTRLRAAVEGKSQ